MLPGVDTGFVQPGIEFFERVPAPLTGLAPDAPSAVLHILLHHAFLPTRGHGCRSQLIKQVVARTWRLKARIDDAASCLCFTLSTAVFMLS